MSSHAIFRPPAPAQRADQRLRARQRGAREPAEATRADALRAPRDPDGDRRQGRAPPATSARPSCRTTRSTSSPMSTRAPPSTSSRRSTQPPRRGATGRAGRGRTARPSSSAPPSCSPGPWRDTLNAATMLGQSKTAHQAEIDAACELDRLLPLQRRVHDADLRRAADLARPASGTGSSTGRSRASSSPSRRSTSPRSGQPDERRRRCSATPSSGSRPRRRCSPRTTLMRLFQEAGLPDGVINLVYGSGADDRRRGAHEPRPRRRPLHRLDRRVPRHVAHASATTSSSYRNYPRIVGETGGKDFIFAHPSADVDALADGDRARRVRVPGAEVLGRVARLRAVELWPELEERLPEQVATIKVGDVADFRTSWAR